MCFSVQTLRVYLVTSFARVRYPPVSKSGATKLTVTVNAIKLSDRNLIPYKKANEPMGVNASLSAIHKIKYTTHS